MKGRSKWPPIYAVCLLAAAVLLGFVWPDSPVQAHSAPGATPPLEIPNIAGNWEGTWADTIYVWATGALTCTILQDGSDFTATGTIDMSVFGMGVVAGTGEGTVTRDGDRATLDFTFSASGIGTGVGALADGSGTGTGTTVPMGFGPFTFEGTATSGAIDGTFDFTDPGGGAGTVHMLKDTPVEPLTWGAIKGRYTESDE